MMKNMEKWCYEEMQLAHICYEEHSIFMNRILYGSTEIGEWLYTEDRTKNKSFHFRGMQDEEEIDVVLACSTVQQLRALTEHSEEEVRQRQEAQRGRGRRGRLAIADAAAVVDELGRGQLLDGKPYLRPRRHACVSIFGLLPHASIVSSSFLVPLAALLLAGDCCSFLLLQ